MKKKSILIIIIVAIIAVAGVLLGIRFLQSGTDIVGVTTLTGKNKVIMNSNTGNEFVSGAGMVTVKEGEHIHLSYKLSSGSFDFAFEQGRDPVMEAAQDMEPGSFENVGESPEEHDVEQTGFEGKGETQFEVDPGDYTVHFIMHDAIGTATVSTKKN